MNHIHELQREVAALKAALKAKNDAAIQFMVFLRGPKFTGTENGERKDWIATGDVVKWLQDTNTESIQAEEQARADWQPAQKGESVDKFGNVRGEWKPAPVGVPACLERRAA